MAAGVELGWMNQVDMEGREPKPKRAVVFGRVGWID